MSVRRVNPLGSLRRGIRLTPRQWFMVLAVVLFLLLIALLVYLLYFLGRPESLGSLPPKEGIRPVWQVYGPGVGDKPLFDRPMGVAVGRSGRVYVTDSGNNRVCVFDANGRFLFEFGGFGVAKPVPGGTYSYKPGRLNYPAGIDVDEDGNVYVASFYNDSIEVYDPDGKPLRRFPDPTKPVGRGSSGQEGGGIAVTDVAVSGDYVFATDQWQVFVFKRDGTFVRQWGKPGMEIGDLDHPNGLAVGADGTVYVSDSNHARVTAFSPDGTPLWTVGTPPKGLNDRSSRPLQLPRGLTVLSDGDVLVADSFAFQLVRISSEEHTVTARYGERGTEPGQLNFPNDVERLRGFLVIADKENGRVQCVRLTGR
ncbi:hypothetical protein MX659_07025 [Coriobacteriia bacterium Es71-Z0120]|uniref:hypothetical protein n=1 Tax=Parvivirga hydrogeniphila TaxID=2939460 RepID=UPI002260CE4F|nr:hypothetical protein [Parvivirga hydrogeniphila]MCL4079333.1 hypothetical protein [Parvivirga hydrogeniphila]